MSQHVNPPVTASAAAHAERLRAREQRAEDGRPAAGQSTAERIAAQILPGYRRDEELREAARLRELKARGVIAADQEPEDVEEDVEYEDEEPEDDGDEEQPLTTAERYAARERKRQQVEHEANVAAQRGAVQTINPQVGNQYPPRVAQPHRYAHVWQKPAS